MYERIVTAAAVGLTLLGFAGSASALDKLIGSVEAVDASAKTVSVQETGASTPTLFSVDAKTRVFEGRKEIALSGLEQGRNVKVSYEKRDGVDVASRIDAELPMSADRTKDMPGYKP